MTSQEQLQQDVQHYAETLESVVSGDESFYEDYCDSEDDLVDCDSEDDLVDCDSEYDRIAKYFEYLLDVEFIVGIDGRYRGARIALAIGGPSIYLNTRNGKIEGYWWSDYAEHYVKRFAVDAIDNYFEEMWESMHC